MCPSQPGFIPSPCALLLCGAPSADMLFLCLLKYCSLFPGHHSILRSLPETLGSPYSPSRVGLTAPLLGILPGHLFSPPKAQSLFLGSAWTWAGHAHTSVPGLITQWLVIYLHVQFPQETVGFFKTGSMECLFFNRYPGQSLGARALQLLKIWVSIPVQPLIYYETLAESCNLLVPPFSHL